MLSFGNLVVDITEMAASIVKKDDVLSVVYLPFDKQSFCHHIPKLSWHIQRRFSPGSQ